MDDKICIPEDEQADAPASQIGATLEALAATIHARRDADEKSYTYRLLTDLIDAPVKKLTEEATEVALAAKDADYATYFAREAADVAVGTETAAKLDEQATDMLNHLRYEAADVIYHLLVVLERFGITTDELAAELNMRMKEGERPRGAVLLPESEVNRGK